MSCVSCENVDACWNRLMTHACSKVQNCVCGLRYKIYGVKECGDFPTLLWCRNRSGCSGIGAILFSCKFH